MSFPWEFAVHLFYVSSAVLIKLVERQVGDEVKPQGRHAAMNKKQVEIRIVIAYFLVVFIYKTGTITVDEAEFRLELLLRRARRDFAVVIGRMDIYIRSRDDPQKRSDVIKEFRPFFNRRRQAFQATWDDILAYLNALSAAQWVDFHTRMMLSIGSHHNADECSVNERSVNEQHGDSIGTLVRTTYR